jgi:hypothetical protein
VLLAAEVVGLVCYDVLAAKLPDCSLRERLLEIAEDDRAQSVFSQRLLAPANRWRRSAPDLRAGLAHVISTARYVVALDNRRPIRDLEIGAETVLSRWKTLARPAEILVASYLQEMRAAMTLTALS